MLINTYFSKGNFIKLLSNGYHYGITIILISDVYSSIIMKHLTDYTFILGINNKQEQQIYRDSFFNKFTSQDEYKRYIDLCKKDFLIV